MLVLSRREGESIIIDNKIEVKFLGSKGNVGRIAVEAPKDISVHRQEIQTKIEMKKKKGGNSNV